MNAERPQAILIDLDDTILDDSRNVTRCWRNACVAHADDLHPIAPETLHDAIEKTRAWYWADDDRHRVGRLDLTVARRDVVRLSLAALGSENLALADRIGDHYGAHRERDIEPIDGAIDTLHWLRAQGFKTALLTNGNAAGQRSKVTRFDLARHFDCVLIEGELGFGKPDPRIYRLALDTIGTSPRETWMIGDNLEWDVVAPQSLGMRGIWIDTLGAGPPEHGASRPETSVRALSELPPLLSGACAKSP